MVSKLSSQRRVNVPPGATAAPPLPWAPPLLDAPPLPGAPPLVDAPPAAAPPTPPVPFATPPLPLAPLGSPPLPSRAPPLPPCGDPSLAQERALTAKVAKSNCFIPGRCCLPPGRSPRLVRL